MRSLLTALQDGRLVELPDNDKEKSLRYLAHLIEAIPELGGHLQVDEEVMIREQQGNTGIGLGVACPHTRAAGEGGLWCAVGWNPAGIDYGSPDGQKVHLVVMYYVPDSQKVAYLKEVSSLASAIKKEGGIQAISRAQDIAGVRNSLLDWVSTAIEAGMPEARARMVRLEARQAAAGLAPAGLQIIPVLIVSDTDKPPIVLSPNSELSIALENDSGLVTLLRQQASFDRMGYWFAYRSTMVYDPKRPVYDYVAVKIG